MRLFERRLAAGGVTMFTTHGRWVAHRIEAVGERCGLTDAAAAALLVDARRTGSAHADDPGTTGYGVSLHTLGRLAEPLRVWRSIRLVAMAERAWDEHQDGIAVQRVG